MRKFHFEYIPSFLLISLIWIIAIFLKWESNFIPPHWDEVDVYMSPIFELYNKGFHNILRPDFFNWNPPGPQLIFYPFILVFGKSYIALKTGTLLLSLTSLALIFLLGEHFRNKFTGFIAALIYFFIPVVFVQFNRFLGDIIFTPFTLLYIYLYLKSKYKSAIVIGLVMGITRQTAIAFGAWVLIHSFLSNKVNKENFMIAISPFITVGIFFAYLKFYSGNYLPHPTFAQNRFTLQRFLDGGFYYAIQNSFLLYGKNILCLFLIPSFLVDLIINRKNAIKDDYFKVLFSSASVFAAFILFFAFDRGGIIRYYMPTSTLLTLLTILYSEKILKWGTVFILPIFIWIALPQYYSHPYMETGGFEDSLTHVSLVKMEQEMGKFIDEHIDQNSIILTAWPYPNKFSRPAFGYVKNQHNAIGYDELKYAALSTDQDRRNYFESLEYEYYLLGSGTDQFLRTHLPHLIKSHELKLIHRLQSERHFIELYKREKLKSEKSTPE